MAKITVVGDVYVITSGKKLEDIKLVERYRPNALKIFDEDGNEVFVVNTNGDGYIGKFGVTFAQEARDGSKAAVITMPIPKNVQDAKRYAVNELGAPLMNLNKIEAGLDAVIAEIRNEITVIENSIEVM
jgi:hypothetical protein